MNRCAMELCLNWAGDGIDCPCSRLGLEPQSPCAAADHPDEGDGVCACGLMVYSPPAGASGTGTGR